MNRTPILILSFVLLALFTVSPAKAEDPVEVLQIDPVLHGVWMIHAFSSDKGKTMKSFRGEPFCKVSSNRVLFSDGIAFEVTKVYQGSFSSIPFQIIHFAGKDFCWIVSTPKPGFVLVQVCEAGTALEKSRLILSISR